MTTSYILILGISAVDTKGFTDGPIVPSIIRISVGGVARNVARKNMKPLSPRQGLAFCPAISII